MRAQWTSGDWTSCFQALIHAGVSRVPESGAQAGSDLVRLFLMTSSTNKEFPVFQVRALKGFPNSCCP